MPNKIFIYNGYGADSSSAEDVKTLFSSGNIFSSCDILLTDFTQNFDGISSTDNHTVIFAGGNASLILDSIAAKAKTNIQSLQLAGSHYVGICAGAFIATEQADVFKTPYKCKYYCPYPAPIYLGDFGRLKNAVPSVCSDYKAIGPFYPNSFYYPGRICIDKDITEKEVEDSLTLKPYCVELALPQKQYLSSLYVAGCGFASTRESKSFEILGTFPKSIDFSYPNDFREEKNFPAIIQKKSDKEKKNGAVLLSGTHIETTVADSKFLSFFAKKATGVIPLKEKEIAVLKNNQNDGYEIVSKILRKALI